MLLEPAQVVSLRGVGRGQLEAIVGQPRDGEIADDAAPRAQHRVQRQPADRRNAPRHDAVQPGPGARAADLVLAEIVHLVDADRAAHRAHFLADRGEGVGAAETRDLVGRLPGGREIVDVLHAVHRAEYRVLRLPDAVGRRAVERPRGGQFLVRIGDAEAALVVFAHLQPGPGRRAVVAETGDIHRHHVARRFAFDQPFGQSQADAAALAETGHHRAGRPVVAQSRYRPDQRVAVRREGERAVDHALDAGLGQHRVAAEREIDRVADALEVFVEQLVAEVPARAVDRPGDAILLVKTDHQAPALLAQVALALGIHHVRQLAVVLDHRGYVVGGEVLVLHRVQRQEDAGHFAHFARPQPGRVDQVLGDHGALLGDHLPAAVGARVGFQHAVAQHDLGALRLRRFRVRMGRA